VAAVAALVLPVLLAGPAAAKAKQSAALATLKVTATNVSVKAKGKSSYSTANNGQVLRQGDTIRTDATGRAEIDYTDGSLTRLGASTIFTISRLTNNRGGRQTQGTLTIGETWNRAAKVSETGSFEVKGAARPRPSRAPRSSCRVPRPVRASRRPAPSPPSSTTSTCRATLGTSPTSPTPPDPFAP